MITNAYINKVAQRLADDISEFRVNDEVIDIEAIDIIDNSVVVTTKQVFFNEDITNIKILDKDRDLIYEKNTSLVTTQNERMSLSVTMKITVDEGVN